MDIQNGQSSAAPDDTSLGRSIEKYAKKCASTTDLTPRSCHSLVRCKVQSDPNYRAIWKEITDSYHHHRSWASGPGMFSTLRWLLTVCFDGSDGLKGCERKQYEQKPWVVHSPSPRTRTRSADDFLETRLGKKLGDPPALEQRFTPIYRRRRFLISSGRNECIPLFSLLQNH